LSTDQPSISLTGPLSRRRLADEVRDRLASAIRAGELRPGERLVEAQLARTLGVSRSPVREALRLLERSGFVVADSGLYYVPRLGFEDLRELVQLRIALERLAVSLIVQSKPPKDLSTLEDIAHRMHEAVSAGSDTAALSSLDAEFHARLCDLPGHARLARMRQEMADEIGLAIAAANLSFPGREGFAEGHDEVITALRTVDRSTAESTIERHILSGLERYELTARNESQAATTG
jgi:DNA-binding GntR family transcriptional regulator